MNQPTIRILSFLVPVYLTSFLISLGSAQEFNDTILESEFERLIQSSKKYVVGIIAHREGLETGAPPAPSGRINLPSKKIASGFIFDVAGLVLTRNSVIQDMNRIDVMLHDGDSCRATLVGIDDRYGFAILHIDRLSFGNPSFSQMNSEKIGNFVLVLGNSLGYYPELWVSKVKNAFPNGIIEIATKIWPGYGGAPVFNLRGQVVGVLAGKLDSKHDDQFEELTIEDEGIVVPMGCLFPEIKKIVDRASAGVAWIGVSVTPIPRGHRNFIFRVTHVAPNSPAEAAGIRIGDQVLAFNGRPIRDIRRVEQVIQSTPIFQNVEFLIKRADSTFSQKVKVGKRPVILATRIDLTPPPSKTSETGLQRFPISQVNRLLLQKRLSQFEIQIQSLKKILQKDSP